MENLLRSILKIQERFDRGDVRSAVIGGVAVGVWGEPRVTRDVDLKVLLGRDQAERLVDLLGDDLKPLQRDSLESLRRQGILFVMDAAGTRVDLLLADTSHDVEAIERSREITVSPGLAIRVCTAEDLVIYKLVATRSRDHEDASGVIRRQGSSLDETYIEGWLSQFEKALDDSTLIQTYRRMRDRWRPRR
jgi:hypothetical protein